MIFGQYSQRIRDEKQKHHQILSINDVTSTSNRKNINRKEYLIPFPICRNRKKRERKLEKNKYKITEAVLFRFVTESNDEQK